MHYSTKDEKTGKYHKFWASNFEIIEG